MCNTTSMASPHKMFQMTSSWAINGVDGHTFNTGVPLCGQYGFALPAPPNGHYIHYTPVDLICFQHLQYIYALLQWPYPSAEPGGLNGGGSRIDLSLIGMRVKTCSFVRVLQCALMLPRPPAPFLPYRTSTLGLNNKGRTADLLYTFCKIQGYVLLIEPVVAFPYNSVLASNLCLTLELYIYRAIHV